MKLRCIGGPHDGVWHEMAQDCKVGNLVAVVAMPSMSVLDFPGDVSSPVKTITAAYIVDEFVMHTQRANRQGQEVPFLRYLRHESMTAEDAIKWQFAK